MITNPKLKTLIGAGVAFLFAGLAFFGVELAPEYGQLLNLLGSILGISLAATGPSVKG